MDVSNQSAYRLLQQAAIAVYKNGKDGSQVLLSQ